MIFFDDALFCEMDGLCLCMWTQKWKQRERKERERYLRKKEKKERKN